MTCPIVCQCCCKNISVCKVIKVTLLFSLHFVVFLGYLCWSDFTLLTTSLSVSFLAAFACTLGISCNAYLRCGAVLFLVNIFSYVGIFVLFLTASWLTFQTTFGAYLINLRLGHDTLTECEENTTTLSSKPLNNTYHQGVDKFLGLVHYSVPVPFLCIYIYSLIYMITYEGVQNKKNSRSHEHKHRGKFHSVCKLLCTHTASFIVGALILATLQAFVFQWIHYTEIVNTLDAKKLDTTGLRKVPYRSIIIYLTVIAILAVCTWYSRKITKFRHSVVRRFLKIEKGVVNPKHDHIFIRKSSGMTLKEFKKYLAKKKLSKKPQDSDEEDSCGKKSEKRPKNKRTKLTKKKEGNQDEKKRGSQNKGYKPDNARSKTTNCVQTDVSSEEFSRLSISSIGSSLRFENETGHFSQKRKKSSLRKHMKVKTPSTVVSNLVRYVSDGSESDVYYSDACNTYPYYSDSNCSGFKTPQSVSE